MTFIQHFFFVHLIAKTIKQKGNKKIDYTTNDLKANVKMRADMVGGAERWCAS